jgi:hypothetical protein
MALRKRLLTFLVRKTVPAPNAVIAQVNSVATKAWRIGERVMNLSMIMVFSLFTKYANVKYQSLFISIHVLPNDVGSSPNPLCCLGGLGGNQWIS